MSSLIRFWWDVPGDATRHPADCDVLHRVKHGFQLDCLPAPFIGRLLTAPIVLLALSPGYLPSDSVHAQTAEWQDYYARSRRGDCDLPSADKHEGSRSWSIRIIKQYGLEYTDVRSKIAVVNVGLYKSKKFSD